jgi:hypothetical protein
MRLEQAGVIKLFTDVRSGRSMESITNRGAFTRRQRDLC